MTTPRLAWFCRALSLLVFAATSAFADYVTGCVQDPSRAAIRGASVTLTGSDNAARIQAQTDEKGCFTIDTEPGRYRIRVLAQGFSPYESDGVPAEKITLQIRPVEAETVVTATRTLSSTGEIASSVDVIDREQIDKSHTQIASDLLRNVGGMTVVRTANTGGLTSLFTRGGESDYTKILIDGIPVNQPGGAYDFAHVPTDNIGLVEIVRGPQSALFGSDAMTGVVQMVTRPGAGSPEGNYSLEGGNYGTLKQSAGVRGAWRRFDWSNTFSRLDTDNIKPNNDYRNASYFGNFGFTPSSRQTVRGTLFHISSRIGTPGVDAPGFTSFGPNDHATNLERAVGLSYNALIGSRIAQHVAYNFYDHNYDYFSDFGLFPTAHTRHRGEYHGDLSFPTTGTLSYGVDFDRENADVDGRPRVRNNTGYYVQQQLEVRRRLNIVAGVRVESNTMFETSTNPKVGLSWRLLDGTRLRFNSGTGVKEPNFIENFSPNPFFVGNPDLLPERSRSWEIGVEQSLARERIVADLTWFDNRFKNVIELVNQRYQNIGRTMARGVEFRTRARVRQLVVQGNYTYLDGHVQESSQLSFPFRPGDPLLRRPRHSGDLTLTWSARKWTARWSTRAVGRRADSDFFSYVVPLRSNAGYSTSDASFMYEFARPVTAFVRLDNVFDRNYQEVLGYLALRRSIVVGARIRMGGEK